MIATAPEVVDSTEEDLGRVVTFQNGNSISNVPPNATKEEIREMAISMGKVTAEEMRTQHPELTPWTESTTEWLKDNAEVPAGVGGAVIGGLLGAPLGPAGVVVGSTIGGSLGSGGGSLASDYLNNEQLDYAEAVKEAAISAGLDVVTMGLGKFVAKPLAAAIKNKMKAGLTPQETADLIISQARAGSGEAGSTESIQATQKFLTEGGATLSAFQTGMADSWQGMQEKIGRLGMVGSGQFDTNTAKINTLVNEGFVDIIGKQGDAGIDPEALGAAVHGLIESGKKQLNKTYGEGLDKIKGAVGGRAAPLAPTKNALEAWLREGRNPLMEGYEPEALKVVETVLANMEKLGSNTVSARSLIQFEKNFKTRINEMSDPTGKQFNSTAAKQLNALSSSFRDSINKSLTVSDPVAAKAYQELNKNYAEAVGTLFPEINKGIILKGNKGSFEGIGNALISDTAPLSATRNMFKSIDESFKQIGGGTLHFADAEAAKGAIREGYLKRLMTDIGEDSFTAAQYSNLAKKMADPKKQAKLAFIMGDKYKATKQLLNVMAEATKNPSSNMGELALKSKEFGTAQAIATATMAGSGSIPKTVMMGAAIFGIPTFMAKASLNPKNVNKIMAFEKRDFKGNKKAMYTAANNLVGDIMIDLSEEDRDDVLEAVNTNMQGYN